MNTFFDEDILRFIIHLFNVQFKPQYQRNTDPNIIDMECTVINGQTTYSMPNERRLICEK